MTGQVVIKRLAILGLGLIGSSFAKGLRDRGVVAEVSAWGHREASLEKGKALGIIDRYSLDLAEAVAGADVVVLATPTQICEQVLAELGELDLGHTVVTDVASVKGNLELAARRLFGAMPPWLVLGHPIAGSEKSGVEAVNPNLFVNHRVILTPTAETDPEALNLITRLWQAVEAEVVAMPVDQHDQVLAATSHLPHMLAYALVDTLVSMESRHEVFRFAAGGFRDFSRIASSHPKMWHDIALANRESLLKVMDDFEQHLAALRLAIETGDSDKLMTTFDRAKKARDEFGEQYLQTQKS